MSTNVDLLDYSLARASLRKQSLNLTSNVLDTTAVSRKDGRIVTKEDKQLTPDQPVKGTLIYILYTFIKSLSFIMTAVLYKKYPTEYPHQPNALFPF